MKKIILVSCLLITNYVFAQSAAKVLFTENKVTATRNGKMRVLSRGAALDVGDEVVTAAKGAIHLQYTNGSLVNIGENSLYKILAYAPKQDVQINAELRRGKLELQNTGKIKESLKTPIVSLAILGTHIKVDVTSPSMTYTQVLDGLVMARGEFLRPGDSVRITVNRIENAPFPKGGSVSSPNNTSGKIEQSGGGRNAESSGGSSSSGTGSSSSVTAVGTPASDSQSIATNSVSTTTVVNNSLVTGTSTTSSTQTIQEVASTAIATISLSCN